MIPVNKKNQCSLTLSALMISGGLC